MSHGIFCFHSGASSLPHYESWAPRYADYLFVAFTNSFAFSPIATLPLTRRAKLVMLLQAAISVVTKFLPAGSDEQSKQANTIPAPRSSRCLASTQEQKCAIELLVPSAAPELYVSLVFLSGNERTRLPVAA